MQLLLNKSSSPDSLDHSFEQTRHLLKHQMTPKLLSFATAPSRPCTSGKRVDSSSKFVVSLGVLCHRTGQHCCSRHRRMLYHSACCSRSTHSKALDTLTCGNCKACAKFHDAGSDGSVHFAKGRDFHRHCRSFDRSCLHHLSESVQPD